MSSTANTIIKLRKSGVSGNAPSDLVYGELAINYADGKLWYKNGTGVKAIYNQKAFDTINANSTLIIAGYADTLSMVGNNGIIITGDGINKKITIDIDKDQFMGATGATGPVGATGATGPVGAPGPVDPKVSDLASAAFNQANASFSWANSAYTQANTATIIANAAYVKASLQDIPIGDYGLLSDPDYSVFNEYLVRYYDCRDSYPQGMYDDFGALFGDAPSFDAGLF